MRWSEIVTSKFYLCTSSQQKTGETIVAEKGEAPLSAEVENALEAKRPEDRLPRRDSVYLSTHPTKAAFVYVVTPEGLERQHTGWLKRLHETDPTQTGVMAHYASGYWSGIECLEAKEEPWEYRAASVKVMRRIGR